MDQDIPKIYFKRDQSLGIEVMNFAQLADKLKHAQNHDPFSVHKIGFFLILLVTKNAYTHFVDFKTYRLSAGSALFIAKNQVHHFTQSLHKADGFGLVFNSLFVGQAFLLSEQLKLSKLFNSRA